MKRVFTSEISVEKVKRTFRKKIFGDQTTCRHCGYTGKQWSIGEDRWKCKRCRKEYSILTNTTIEQTRFSLQQILELLYWFELELSDHKIANHADTSYHRVHRFFITVRKAITTFENAAINLLENQVEVDETYFGTDLKNRRKKKREKLRKEGRVKRGREANDYKQAIFGIYERTDGIVYTELVEDVTKPTLQDILKDNVSVETTIYSDPWTSYNGLEGTFEDHKTVNHSEEEYRRGTA